MTKFHFYFLNLQKLTHFFSLSVHIQPAKVEDMWKINTIIFLLIPDVFAFDAYNCEELSPITPYDITEPDNCGDFQEFWKNEEVKEVQVVQSKVKEKVKITQCQVLTSLEAEFCGQTWSHNYGVDETLERNKHYYLSAEECYKLKNENILRFRHRGTYDDINIGNNNHFSAEVVVAGERKDGLGKCVAGSFNFNSKSYTSHVIRYVLEIKIINREADYNGLTKSIQIEDEQVPISNLVHQGTWTTVWNIPNFNCHQSTQEIYRGRAKIYKNNGTQLQQVALINDDKKKQFFAIQLIEKTSHCDRVFWTTQFSGTFIALNTTKKIWKKDWAIEGLQGVLGEDVDIFTHIRGLVSGLYVSTGQYWSEAFVEIGKKICQSSTELIKTNLSLMRQNIENGIKAQFGKGFHGILRGGTVMVYKCKTIDVRTRNIPNITQDIPVQFEDKYGNTRNMFVDSLTGKIKNTTVFLKHSNLFPVMVKIEDHWFCNNNFTKPCKTAQEIPLKTSNIIDVLEHEPDLGYDYTIEDENNFAEIVYSESEQNDVARNLGRALTSHDYKKIVDNLNIPKFKERLDEVQEKESSVWYMIKLIIAFLCLFIIGRSVLVIFQFTTMEKYQEYWSWRNFFLVFFWQTEHLFEKINRERVKFVQIDIDNYTENTNNILQSV